MINSFIILDPSKQTTTEWSGGTTTQLYIFPEESSFAEKNFQFRISTAKVAVTESDFTPFQGYERMLMILDGSLFINHHNQYSRMLNQYDVDVFNGDWKTNAKGLVTDFNVIFKDIKGGSLFNESIKKGTIKPIYSEDFFAAYLVKGKANLIVEDNNTPIHPLTFFACHGQVSFTLEATEDCVFVFVKLVL